MTYLKMPLQLQSAVAKKLQRCSYQESIAQHIMLLILSHHGEVIGREDFGSMIWDLEFNQLVKISDWEEGVKNSLIKTIEKYEKRLRNVDVNVRRTSAGRLWQFGYKPSNIMPPCWNKKKSHWK